MLRNPEWRRITRPADHVYIDELFQDFNERIQADPEGLFAQASELSVGPLTTHCAGSDPQGLNWLLELRDRFARS